MLASQDHMGILKSGVGNWNKWREENKTTKPELEFAYLRSADLGGANLAGAYLDSAYLRDAYLRGADLGVANLAGANLAGDTLEGANLGGADLHGANLHGADLLEVDLRGADLAGTDLGGADIDKVKSFYKAKLDPKILILIKGEWPEKLVTIWDDTKKDWVVNDTLLEQVKKPDWHGWPAGK